MDLSRTLIDVLGVDGFLSRMEKIRESTGKNILICCAGGEPTLAANFAELCGELTRRKFYLNITTNFITKQTLDIIQSVDPKGMAMIEAAYHWPTLDKNEKLRERYFKNFNESMSRGITTVVKYIAAPKIVDDLENRLEVIKSKIPKDSPVLIQNYIEGCAWPSSYSQKHREILSRLMKYRRENNKTFWNKNANHYKGMFCDSGRGMIYMDVGGIFHRCVGMEFPIIGNLSKGTLKLLDGPTKCPMDTCGCGQVGMWYGQNPWQYLKGVEKKDAYWCRFGPNPGFEPRYEQ